MATIKETIAGLMKSALKEGLKEKLGWTRNLHAAVRKKEIDDRIDLDDEGIRKIIGTLVKQRNESIEQFKKGGREDLVANETAELAFLMTFMPAQLSEAEVRKFIDEAIAKVQAKDQKDIGKVMGVLMPNVQGKADGKLINQIVRERLTSK